MRFIRQLAVLTLSLATYSVLADDQSSTTYQSGWLYVAQGEGFFANVPAQASRDLLTEAQKFRTMLKNKEIQCIEKVENSRFKTKDTLITVIMPGGLIWAASKKHRHSQAKVELGKVTGQLDELETDLAMLKITSSREALALLK